MAAPLPGTRCGLDGGVHVAASAPYCRRAPTRRGGGDWRAAPDPLVLLVPDRSRRMADSIRPGGAEPSGTSAAMGSAPRGSSPGRSPKPLRPWRGSGPPGVDPLPGCGAPLPRWNPRTTRLADFEQPFRCVYELVGTRGSSRYLTPTCLPRGRQHAFGVITQRKTSCSTATTSTPRWLTPFLSP